MFKLTLEKAMLYNTINVIYCIIQYRSMCYTTSEPKKN